MAEPVVSSVVVARLVAAVAQEVPDVLGLHGGSLGEVATYGPDGPVRGVRVERTPPRVRLHTVVRFGARLDEVADEVRRRVRTALAAQVPALADATVDVHVVDVRQPGREPGPDAEASASESHAHERP